MSWTPWILCQNFYKRYDGASFLKFVTTDFRLKVDIPRISHSLADLMSAKLCRSFRNFCPNYRGKNHRE